MDTTAETSLSLSPRLFPFRNDYDDFLEIVVQENRNTLYVRDLDSTTRGIRLLRFEPGQDCNGPVRLFTRYIPLDDAKNMFEALSYTWNNPIPKGSRLSSTGPLTPVEPPDDEIFVNTQKFKATPNLYFALRRIRQNITALGRYPYSSSIPFASTKGICKNGRIR
jgi:hypothetical protein